MRELRRVLVSSGPTVGSCSPLPGTLPRPSISAEPGSVVPWGRPVSIVCRGPAGVRSFRLEKDNRHNYTDVAVTSRGEQETEARLHITALHKDAVGRYHCIYRIDSRWSELSEALSLEGTEEAVSALPTGVPGTPLRPLSTGPTPAPGPAAPSAHRPPLSLGPLPPSPLPTRPPPPCLAQLPKPGLSGHHGGLDAEPQHWRDTQGPIGDALTALGTEAGRREDSSLRAPCLLS